MKSQVTKKYNKDNTSEHETNKKKWQMTARIRVIPIMMVTLASYDSVLSRYLFYVYCHISMRMAIFRTNM